MMSKLLLLLNYGYTQQLTHHLCLIYCFHHYLGVSLYHYSDYCLSQLPFLAVISIVYLAMFYDDFV